MATNISESQLSSVIIFPLCQTTKIKHQCFLLTHFVTVGHHRVSICSITVTLRDGGNLKFGQSNFWIVADGVSVEPCHIHLAGYVSI